MRAPRPSVVLAVLLAACSGGSSSPSQPPVCPASVDDGNICTADSCDPATGVVTHAPVSVDDGDACTVDACDPIAGVTHTPVAVDDGVACTTDSCSGGVAVHTPVDAACAPDGYCDPLAGCVAYPVLASFGPPVSFVYVGQSDAATIPSPATVSLTGPAHADTSVSVYSADPTIVTVPNGVVTIPAGATSAVVPVTGVSPGYATLWATLGATTLNTTVRAVDPAAPVTLQSLRAPTAALVPYATVTFTVTLDTPALAGGADVAISLSPSDAGVVPAIVTVPEGQLSATFDYVDGGTTTWVRVTATLGGNTDFVMLFRPALVINEVDYDQPVTDTAEFVEIYNPSGIAYDLTGVALYLVNGASSPATSYLRIPLSGSVSAGGYLLVASRTVVAPAVLRVDFALASGNVQNGPADAIALVDENTLRVIDAVAYDGTVGPAVLGALPGTFPVTEVAPAPADPATTVGSICRFPNGADTDDNSANFRVCTTPTPGAANAL